MPNKKALVAMSGGVDSSVSAFLMKEAGYDPIGVTMMLHENDAGSIYGTHTCCTIDDIEDARVVASHLGIPFSVVNFIDGFKEKIIDKFVKTYLGGATPNPCIDCNKYMKFGRLFEMAEKEGCEKVVTGHYATVEYDLEDDRLTDSGETKGRYKLRRGVDRTKDQTYVLYFLNQEQLSKLEFPLGKYEKTEVRKIADDLGLGVATKHDSQDICFVPDGDYAGYIEREYSDSVPEKVREDSENAASAGGSPTDSLTGHFIGKDGKDYGPHKGYYHYTIGQRRGLGIPAGDRIYVVDIMPETNTVILGTNEDLFRRDVHAVDFNLISLPKEYTENGDDIEMRVTAKVRYRAKDTAGILTLHKDGTADMLFDEPVRAVTPGQSLVIYDDEYCLGGGIITSR